MPSVLKMESAMQSKRSRSRNSVRSITGFLSMDNQSSISDLSKSGLKKMKKSDITKSTLHLSFQDQISEIEEKKKLISKAAREYV